MTAEEEARQNLNYCQFVGHYNYAPELKRYLHRSDTDEMKACLEEQWKLKGIGKYRPTQALK